MTSHREIIGLSGGYIPNTCYHVRGIDNAREALLSELEHIGDTLIDPRDLHTFEEARRQFIGLTDAEVEDGYGIATDEHHEVRLEPIAEEDFEEDDED